MNKDCTCDEEFCKHHQKVPIITYVERNETNIFIRTNDGKAYRSYDEGTSWIEVKNG